MMEWLKRPRARKLWRSMLSFYEAHNEDLPDYSMVHFVLAMDHVKRISEGRK